jgi:hypothetical protein
MLTYPRVRLRRFSLLLVSNALCDKLQVYIRSIRPWSLRPKGNPSLNRDYPRNLKMGVSRT